MPTLKITKPSYDGEIDYDDLDQFLNEVYGRDDIEVQAMQLWSNDSQNVWYVKKGKIDAYDQKHLDRFNRGEQLEGILNTLGTDLANRNLVPEGRYLVKVSY